MTAPRKCLANCGKTLTSEESLARGYGKACWKKLHGTPGRTRILPPAAEAGPGQPELPLDDQLPLWSTP